MKPGHLAAHVAAFAGDEAIGLVASASEVIDERGDPVAETVVGRGGLGPVNRIFPAGTLASAMVEGNPLRCSAVTIRRAAFDDVGGFDPRFRYVVDWDFWLRVSRRWKVAWLARPTVTGPLACGQRDASLQGRHGRPGRIGDDAGDPVLRRSESGLGRPSATTHRNPPARPRVPDPRPRRPPRRPLRPGPRGASPRIRDLAPSQVSTMLREPRLGIQLGTLALAPTLARRLFGPRA